DGRLAPTYLRARQFSEVSHFGLRLRGGSLSPATPCVPVGHFFYDLIDAAHEVGPIVSANSFSTGATHYSGYLFIRSKDRHRTSKRFRLRRDKEPCFTVDLTFGRTA